MALRHNQSLQYLNCIPYYDYLITNKSYILNDMKRLGAKIYALLITVMKPNFTTLEHYLKMDYDRLGGDVGFCRHVGKRTL